MQRPSKFIVIPAVVWDNKQLSLLEKAVMIELFSFADDDNVVQMKTASLARHLAQPLPQVKEAVAHLQEQNLLQYSGECFALMPRGEFSAISTTPPQEADSAHIDYEEVARAWTAFNPNAGRPTRFSEQRKRAIRACLKRNNASVEDLITAFKIVPVSDLLSGRSTSWRATFDWVISDSKGCFQKILDGMYCTSPHERAAYIEIIESKNQPKPTTDYE